MDKSYIFCDRCGAEIHRNHFPRMELTVTGAFELDLGAYEYTDEEYVLCKKCCEEFKSFMKEGADK